MTAVMSRVNDVRVRHVQHAHEHIPEIVVPDLEGFKLKRVIQD